VSEHSEQCALIERCAWEANRVPALRLLFAVPNGGARHPAIASKLKAEGVRAGVPDLLLPVARRGYHALWIELKTGRYRPSPPQLWWHEHLRAEGYQVEVCYGADAAWNVIADYLGLEATP